MSRDKFEAWWMKAERQRIDELYVPSSIAYAAWLAGRESMRDEAAEIAEKHEEGPGGSEAIRNIEP